jgi:hypothetical protein
VSVPYELDVALRTLEYPHVRGVRVCPGRRLVDGSRQGRGTLAALRPLFEHVLLIENGPSVDNSSVGRLRYLLAATLALAAVGVGVERVLLGGAYQTLPPQPQPALWTGPPPNPPASEMAKTGPGTARARASVRAAVVAIELYAAAHGHSYRGATGTNLHRYDPQLDGTVHVFSATADSYCVESNVWGSAASQSGPTGPGIVELPCSYTA